jgi:hypothetical protein
MSLCGFSWLLAFLMFMIERELEVELDVYNPNISDDREELIRRYCLNLPYLSIGISWFYLRLESA